MEKMLLTISELVGVTGIGRTRCCELVGRGEIPSLRVGKLLRIPLVELERWIHAQTEERATERDGGR